MHARTPEQTQWLYYTKENMPEGRKLKTDEQWFCCSSTLPASFCSGGSGFALVFSALLHLTALGLTIASVVHNLTLHNLNVVNGISYAAISFISVAFVSTTLCASVFERPTDQVFLNFLTISCHLCAIIFTSVLFVLSIFANETKMEDALDEHLLLLFSVILQVFSAGLWLSFVINMIGLKGDPHFLTAPTAAA